MGFTGYGIKGEKGAMGTKGIKGKYNV